MDTIENPLSGFLYPDYPQLRGLEETVWQELDELLRADLSVDVVIDEVQQAIARINKNNGRTENQSEETIYAKVFDDDPQGKQGRSKPGEAKEIAEVIAAGEPPHLIADEAADSAYYAFQLADPVKRDSLLSSLSQITGWTREQLSTIALIKYRTRSVYGRDYFIKKHVSPKAAKDEMKRLEQDMMRRYFEKNLSYSKQYTDHHSVKALQIIDQMIVRYREEQKQKLKLIQPKPHALISLSALADLDTANIRANARFAAAHNYPHFSSEDQEEVLVKIRGDTSQVAFLADHIGIPSSEMDIPGHTAEREQYLAEEMKTIAARPGVEELITVLKDRTINMHIATSLSHTQALEVLDRLAESTGIAPAELRALLLEVESPPGQSKEDFFRTVLEHMHTPPTDVMLLTTTPRNVRAGLAAGMQEIFVQPNRALAFQPKSFGLDGKAQRVTEIDQWNDLAQAWKIGS